MGELKRIGRPFVLLVNSPEALTARRGAGAGAGAGEKVCGQHLMHETASR